jgi:hypothetical protein
MTLPTSEMNEHVNPVIMAEDGEELTVVKNSGSQVGTEVSLPGPFILQVPTAIAAKLSASDRRAYLVVAPRITSENPAMPNGCPG